VLVTELIHVFGVINLVLAPVGVLVLLAVRVSGSDPVDAPFVALLAALLLGGLTFGGLLMGMAALIRFAYVLAKSARRAARPEVDQPVTFTAPTAEDGLSTARSAADHDPSRGARLDGAHEKSVIALLREIRDLTVLSPVEREEAGRRIAATQQRFAAESIIDAINLRQIARARNLLAEAKAAYGSTATFDKLADKIEKAEARNEPLDYTRTRRLVEEAIAEGDFSLAEQYAHAAHRDHSDSQRCRALWDSARRARLHAHVQASADHHHWSEAIAAAEEFLERFPDSPEAEGLRGQVATLRRNAEIAERKRYEHRFKELIGLKNYGEALRIAKHVVERFPGSPQALALRDQVPVLERKMTR
jgi:hypothetical protein